MKSKEEGITLVALIISIIILIILSAVTIKAFWDSHFIDIAMEGTVNYAKAQGDEVNMMQNMADVLDETLNSIGKGRPGSTGGPSEPGGDTDILEGTITFGKLNWNGGKASVTISTSESYRIEYKVINDSGSTEYKEIANGGTIQNLNLGDIVVARLAHDTASGIIYSDTASITVQDITPPSTPTIVLSGTAGQNGWYTSNVTVTITPGTDSESGVNRTTYKITGAQSTAETTGTSVTITAEGTSEIIAYTYNNAGLKTESERKTIKIDKTSIAFTQNTRATKNASASDTITVTATAEKAGKNLTYTLYWGTDENNLDNSESQSNKSSGDPVTFTKSGLANYTVYYFRVDVNDDATTATGNTVNCQTYCSKSDTCSEQRIYKYYLYTLRSVLVV